jgi:hypothetical protein
LPKAGTATPAPAAHRTRRRMGGCAGPPRVTSLHDFPDPGKFHRFPCSSPPLGHIRQASDLRIYYR